MAIQLSDTDKAIINALQRDGKATNASVARETGVSEETIRRRSNRLIQEEVIKVTGIPDASKLGYECEVLIGIQTAPDKLDDVASALSALDEVSAVSIEVDPFSEEQIIGSILCYQIAMHTLQPRPMGHFLQIALNRNSLSLFL